MLTLIKKAKNQHGVIELSAVLESSQFPCTELRSVITAIASGASTFLSAGAAMGGANSSISTWFN